MFNSLQVRPPQIAREARRIERNVREVIDCGCCSTDLHSLPLVFCYYYWRRSRILLCNEGYCSYVRSDLKLFACLFGCWENAGKWIESINGISEVGYFIILYELRLIMKNMKVDNIKSLIELLTNESVVVKFSIGSDLLLL